MQLKTTSLAVMSFPFDHDDWLFEIKYDAWRAPLLLDHGGVRLLSRNQKFLEAFS